MTVTLREFQGAATAECMRLFSIAKTQLEKHICLYSPTGSGKSVMGAAVIQEFLDSGFRINFVVHRKNLVHQMARHLIERGISCGVWQAENTRRVWERCVVSSIDTLRARKVGLKDTHLVVIDEAHGATSKRYIEFLEAYDGYVLGLTATPFSKGMGKVFGHLVVASTIPSLIEQGYLVDIDVYAPSEPDMTGVKTVAGDYSEKEAEQRVNKVELVGDIVDQWQLRALGKRTVCFAHSIAHSQAITAKFVSQGIPAEHIDAYTSDDDRAEILARFEAGSTLILSNCDVFSEGWDCPAAEVCILAKPTKSLIRYIQRAGRVLRPFPGKAKAIMLDHSGTALQLGYPTDELPLVLDDGKPDQASVATKKKPEQLPKKCPECQYLKKPGQFKCPACGHTPKLPSNVKTLHGELGLLRKKSPSDMPDMEFRRRFYLELKGWGVTKGYAPGYASACFKERYGEWPPREWGRLPDMGMSQDTFGWIKAKTIAYRKAIQRPTGGRW